MKHTTLICFILLNPKQIYPAKIPYYKDMGRVCDPNMPNSCGVMGKCQEGVCRAVPYNKSVFGVNI